MSENKKFNILNLVGQLSDALVAYFEQVGANVLTRETCQDFSSLNYILVSSEEQASEVSIEFDAVKNNITLVCIGRIENTKKFLLNNGRSSIEDYSFSNSFSKIVLDKFFTKNFSIHLDESFQGKFRNIEDVKVTSIQNMGSDTDVITLDAFDKNYNIVTIRSFLDHVLYFFAYLKQAGLAGVPYEIEYAESEEGIYCVNLYLSVRNFVAEYIIDSFGLISGKDPSKYLMGIIEKSCDFLEVTFIEEPGKLVISGLWNKLEENQAKICGMSFNNVKTTAQLISEVHNSISAYKDAISQTKDNNTKTNQTSNKNLPGGFIGFFDNVNRESILKIHPDKTIKLIAFVVQDYEKKYPDRNASEVTLEDLHKYLAEYEDQDFISKMVSNDHDILLDRIHNMNSIQAYEDEIVRIKESLKDDDDFKQVVGESLLDELARRVAGSLENEDGNQIVSGDKLEKDDFKALVSGLPKGKENPFLSKISGSFENEKGKFNVVSLGGAGPEKKKAGLFSMIKSSMDSIDSLDEVKWEAKAFVKEKGQKHLESKLHEFTGSLGISIEDLNEEQITEFQSDVLPQALDDLMNNEEAIESFYDEKLASNNRRYDTIEIKQVLTQKIAENELSYSDLLGNKEKVVQTVSDTFKLDTDAATIVVNGTDQLREEKEREIVLEKIINNEIDLNDTENVSDNELIRKLAESEAYTIELEKKLKVLEIKLAASEATNKKIETVEAEIAKKVAVELSKSGVDGGGIPEEEVNKLRQGTMSPEDMAKMAILIEKEKGLQNLAREAEKTVRKLQIESEQKEAHFKAEIEKGQKFLKAKEAMVEHIKNSVQNLVSKKDAEITSLRDRVTQMNQKMNDESALKMKRDLQLLEQENSSLKKMGDIYRTKIENMVKKSAKLNKEEELKKIQDEMRALNNMKTQLQNQLNAELKRSKSFEDKYMKSKEEEMKNRQEMAKQKTDLKSQEAQIKFLRDSLEKLAKQAPAESSTSEKNNASEENVMLKQENAQLTQKVMELSDTLKKFQEMEDSSKQSGSTSDSNGTAKEKKLESDIKKLQAEIVKGRTAITESKKDIMKYKSENTAMKNQVQMLKREIEKFRQLAAKKGGKKAA